MGEVYRADDLRLGQPVALKFLPGAVERDPMKLAQFHNEARLARQVAHPNVCRVYDIGEAEGTPFLTMEYVDGEDLASLIRRIGRLPVDKGLEIARQLCAGLAAAHDRGVLHRDLKPSNVMLDGDGKVRLTDFGLAALSGSVDVTRAGTPAYMAPEQLAGREVTPRSDVYALGLVLYEIFTGRRALDVSSIGDLVRRQEQKQIAPPGTIVQGFDPAIERVILQCLEFDPSQRPASALGVSAALPGGDPLIAALAAGETPSPQMVAAAGRAEGLSPAMAIASALGVCALVVLAIWVADTYSLPGRLDFVRPPDALTDRAEQLLQALGYTDPPTATARGFYDNTDYQRFLQQPEGRRFRTVRFTGHPGALRFYYRTSPRTLAPIGRMEDVNWWNPPVNVSGMTMVTLDEHGWLDGFQAVPREVEAATPTPMPPDWAPLFKAAGLDPARLATATPMRTPPTYADMRAAWRGEWPDRPGVPLRIEAASYHGRPVYFAVIAPWSLAWRDQEPPKTTAERAVNTLVTICIISLLLVATLVARSNVRHGRGDLPGAARIAAVMGLLTIAAWALDATHLPDPSNELNRFFEGVGISLLMAALGWVLYVALEPWVRKTWPNSLKGWTRLLAGHVRDARVGRDVLIGAALGTLVQLTGMMRFAGAALIAHEIPSAPSPDIAMYNGMRHALGALTALPFTAMFNAMWCVFMIVGLKMLLRKMWLAVLVTLAFYLMLSVPAALNDSTPVIAATASAVSVALLVAVPIRFGLLAACVAFLFNYVLSAVPWTADPGDWRSSVSMLALAMLVGIAAFGAWAAASDSAATAPARS